MLSILFSIPLIFIAGFLAYKRPVWSVAFILVLLPTFLIRWNIIGLPINTLDVLITVSAVMWAITHISEIKMGVKKYRNIVLILQLWFIVASISLNFSPDPVLALGILKSYFLLPILFILQILFTIKTKKDVQIILSALTLLVLYNSIFGILQLILPNGIAGFNDIPNSTWRDPEQFRITGILQYPNALALLIAPLLPMVASGFLFFGKKYERLLIITTLLFGLSAIFFAKSKGALLALILTLLIALIYHYRKRIWLISASSILFVLLLIPFTDVIISKFGISSFSAQLRFAGWQEAIYLLADNPIIGAGLGGYQLAIAPYHTTPFLEIFLYPHNIILNFWTELGIIGLFVTILILIVTYIKNYQLSKTAPLLALSSVAALTILILHGIVDVPYFKNDLSIIFLLLFIWPCLLENLKPQERN